MAKVKKPKLARRKRKRKAGERPTILKLANRPAIKPSAIRRPLHPAAPAPIQATSVSANSLNLAHDALNRWLTMFVTAGYQSADEIMNHTANMFEAHSYEDSDAMERMLIERLVIGWLQLTYADVRLSQESAPDAVEGRRWQKQQQQFSVQFLAAVKALTAFRKAMRIDRPIPPSYRREGNSIARMLQQRRDARRHSFPTAMPHYGDRQTARNRGDTVSALRSPERRDADRKQKVPDQEDQSPYSKWLFDDEPEFHPRPLPPRPPEQCPMPRVDESELPEPAVPPNEHTPTRPISGHALRR